jgi:purine-binding chemotaxis protein CheW
MIATDLDQDVLDEVYRRRARQLAERPADEHASATSAVLVFRVGAERYGLELADLAEVFAYHGCTVVPGASPALLGVINVRGEIRCVVDLRRLLQVSADSDSASGYVAMLRRQGGRIGLRIDGIDEVRRIDPADLRPVTGGTMPAPGSRFVKAVTADAVILIDATAPLPGVTRPSAQTDSRRT